MKLPYALGVSSQLPVFLGTPRVAVPPATGRRGPRTRLALLDDVTPKALSRVATTVPARAWRRITWRNGHHDPWQAEFAALRVTPAHAWRRRQLAPEVWLLCQRPCGGDTVVKYFFVHLPATTSLQKLVTLAHQRWAIEQQYQDLKDELGFDHFEGRSYEGWHHHAVLTTVAYTFLQRERAARGSGASLTFPIVRGLVGRRSPRCCLPPRVEPWKRPAMRASPPPDRKDSPAARSNSWDAEPDARGDRLFVAA